MSYLPSKAAHPDNRFDVLRLLAAWLVLFSHSYPLGGRPGNEPLASTLGIDTFGGLGVAVFFVLSGYLVTLSLERSPSLWVFARRRAIRIYPALLVACLLCVFVLGLWISKLPWLEYLSHGVTWSYLYTASAWTILYALPGVFEANPVAYAVNGSLWSLPYEITCYLSLVVLVLLPLGRRLKISVVSGILVVFVVLRPDTPPISPFLRFWGLDFYHGKLGFLFAIGAFFACWRGVLVPRWWIGLVMIGLAFAFPHGGWQMVLFFGGFGICILWLALEGAWLPAIPSWMGDWSYGTYLYGFPVQQLLAYYGVQNYGFWFFVVACTFLTLVLAGLSWHWVEKPALRWK